MLLAREHAYIRSRCAKTRRGRGLRARRPTLPRRAASEATCLLGGVFAELARARSAARRAIRISIDSAPARSILFFPLCSAASGTAEVRVHCHTTAVPAFGSPVLGIIGAPAEPAHVSTLHRVQAVPGVVASPARYLGRQRPRSLADDAAADAHDSNSQSSTPARGFTVNQERLNRARGSARRPLRGRMRCLQTVKRRGVAGIRRT